jgi:uncharacterized protein YbbC (DUF1343 family)
MSGFFRFFSLQTSFAGVALALGLLGCSASQPPPRPVARATSTAAPAAAAPSATAAQPVSAFPVMLGIDVLESQDFAAVKGKRLGLLTHPAGVNRRGERTVDVLRRAPGVKLVALYGPEHGVNGDAPAEIFVNDTVDKRTGLPAFSVYGKFRKPTKSQLKGLEAMVIDLQDIGTRSYTFVSAMKLTMEACFENNIEVIVLDRPNPLGGLKVDGPLLDAKWKSYVGAFRVPYVHGLTIGELARMAKEAPGVLDVSDAVRARGKLTVIPMRGWLRSMRWPETGLPWVPTSQMIQDFSACVGYAMVGLGTYFDLDPKIKFDIGFRHGVGVQYAFRGISHKTVTSAIVERELRALKLPGLSFRRVSSPGRDGKPETGVYIEVTDWDDWNPTELSFYLMRLACRLEKTNPFAVADVRASGFLRHMGSEEFFRALQRDGAKTDVAAFVTGWQKHAKVYQTQSKKYWLYR